MMTVYKLVGTVSKSCLCILLFTISVGLAESQAAELKIVDGKGLTRAFKKIAQPTDIHVMVTTPIPQDREKSLMLSNVDGLAADITAHLSDSNILIFQKVRDGTWKLKGFDGLTISQVKVQ